MVINGKDKQVPLEFSWIYWSCSVNQNQQGEAVNTAGRDTLLGGTEAPAADLTLSLGKFAACLKPRPRMSQTECQNVLTKLNMYLKRTFAAATANLGCIRKSTASRSR